MRKDNEVWKHEKNWLSDRKLRFLGEEQNPFIFLIFFKLYITLKKGEKFFKVFDIAHIQF